MDRLKKRFWQGLVCRKISNWQISTSGRLASSRGDVPGWVLVTVMSAGLVTMLWFLADGLLADVFSRAVDSVTGP